MKNLSTPMRRTAAAVATGAAALTMAVTAAPAHASSNIDVDYDISGTTYIASTESTVSLGPTVMATSVAPDGSLTASMDLPGTRTTFSALGFLPVTADVSFISAGPTTGSLTRVGRTQVVKSTSHYYVRLSNIKVGTIFPLIVGSKCRTSEPVAIQADTPAGEAFAVGAGGHLTGTYTIGDFENCGINTWLINELVPGAGNTIDLTLSNGRLAS